MVVVIAYIMVVTVFIIAAFIKIKNAEKYNNTNNENSDNNFNNENYNEDPIQNMVDDNTDI